MWCSVKFLSCSVSSILTLLPGSLFTLMVSDIMMGINVAFVLRPEAIWSNV